MAFSLKNWINKGETGTATPLSAGAMKDLETRLSAYSETFVNGVFGNLSVTTAKIAELAVTTAKLGNQAVSTEKIGEQSVTSAKLASGAVTSGKLAELSVAEGSLIDRAVSSRKLRPSNGQGFQTSGGTLTETVTLLPGSTLKVTPAIESVGVFIINGVFEQTGAAANNVISLYIDGTLAGSASMVYTKAPSEFTTTYQVSATIMKTLSVAQHTFELKGSSTTGGTSVANASNYYYLIYSS